MSGASGLCLATKSLPVAPKSAKKAAAQELLACGECGRHFVSSLKLKSHEKTHSKSRPFKCIDCGKTFTVRYSLICHTRTHTRERPYQCSSCGSRFTQASSLKTHQIYKHTKAFPYDCALCGRGFISPGQRHEHVVRSHATRNSAPAAGHHAPGRKKKEVDGVAREGAGGGRQTTSQGCQTALSLPPIL